MLAFPPIDPTHAVDATDWTSAVDFVNRVNWRFETWDVEAMIDSFQPDAVAYHFHGTIRGHAEIRRFFEQDYPYLIPGVSRTAHGWKIFERYIGGSTTNDALTPPDTAASAVADYMPNRAGEQ